MESTAAVLVPDHVTSSMTSQGMSGMCDVTRYKGDTKGLLFSSIYVNIVLFSIICVNIVLFSTHTGVTPNAESTNPFWRHFCVSWTIQYLLRYLKKKKTIPTHVFFLSLPTECGGRLSCGIFSCITSEIYGQTHSNAMWVVDPIDLIYTPF